MQNDSYIFMYICIIQESIDTRLYSCIVGSLMNTDFDLNEKQIKLFQPLTDEEYVNLSRDSSRILCEDKVITNDYMQKCCDSSSLPPITYLIRIHVLTFFWFIIRSLLVFLYWRSSRIKVRALDYFNLESNFFVSYLSYRIGEIQNVE